MEQIGWFVVGDGNFGPYLFGNQKSEPVGPVFIETEQLLLIQKTNQEVDKILEIMDNIKHKIETLENK